MTADLFTIVAPLFICASVGFGWIKFRQPFDSETVTSLSINVGVPTLAFAALVNLEVDIAAFGEMAVAALVAIGCFFALGGFLLRALRLSLADYLPALAFPNLGNMGLPLCLFAFGDVGLTYGIAWYLVAAIIQLTFGVWIASGARSPRLLVRTPVIWAVALALPFMALGTRPPDWIMNAVELFAGFTIPLMLFNLGVTLAKLRIAGFGRGLGLSLVRLGMGFGVGVAVAELFGFEGVAWGVMILQATMPVAVINFALADRYGRAPMEIASMVLISTVISYATLPALLMVVL